MAKIAEANTRMFKGVFVCRKCKSKIRSDNARVRAGKVKCRKCACKAFRPKRAK